MCSNPSCEDCAKRELFTEPTTIPTITDFYALVDNAAHDYRLAQEWLAAASVRFAEAGANLRNAQEKLQEFKNAQ